MRLYCQNGMAIRAVIGIDIVVVVGVIREKYPVCFGKVYRILVNANFLTPYLTAGIAVVCQIICGVSVCKLIQGFDMFAGADVGSIAAAIPAAAIIIALIRSEETRITHYRCGAVTAKRDIRSMSCQTADYFITT